MAVTYRIDSDARIVYLMTISNTSLAEWREAMLAVLADPSYHPGFSFLSDRREETDVPSAEFAREAADFLKQHCAQMGSFRWAAVSDSPAVYGMMRMFSIFSELMGVQAEAFPNYEEALEWVRGAYSDSPRQL